MSELKEIKLQLKALSDMVDKIIEEKDSDSESEQESVKDCCEKDCDEDCDKDCEKDCGCGCVVEKVPEVAKEVAKEVVVKKIEHPIPTYVIQAHQKCPAFQKCPVFNQQLKKAECSNCDVWVDSFIDFTTWMLVFILLTIFIKRMMTFD